MNDVRGARAAGMRAVWLDRDGAREPPPARMPGSPRSPSCRTRSPPSRSRPADSLRRHPQGRSVLPTSLQADMADVTARSRDHVVPVRHRRTGVPGSGRAGAGVVFAPEGFSRSPSRSGRRGRRGGGGVKPEAGREDTSERGSFGSPGTFLWERQPIVPLPAGVEPRAPRRSEWEPSRHFPPLARQAPTLARAWRLRVMARCGYLACGITGPRRPG